jgi:hypothetical protein
MQVAVNGNMPYTNILADGASTTLGHSQNADPETFETVNELQVSTSSFSAQYGIGGIIINQISKGGTNHFHGAAYDYIQNDALEAYNYGFGNPVSVLGPIPLLRYNNFGGAVSGPIRHNKAFFYFNYDQIVNHSAWTSYGSVPTTAVMGGDFTGLWDIYDPTTQTIAADSQGNPYPVRQTFASEYGKNAIPTAIFDRLANGVQQFFPTPSNHIPNGNFATGYLGNEGEPQSNFVARVPSNAPYKKYFGRLDYDITPKNRLTMSDKQSDTPQLYSSGVFACPITCQTGDADDNSAQVTDVWNISDRTINEMRFGYTWEGSFFLDTALGKGYSKKLGWQYAKTDDIPGIQFWGNYPYAWPSPNSNSVFKQHIFDPSDVVTMIRGKHILHFGGEFLMYQDNSTAWGAANAGAMAFTGQYTQGWAVDPVTGIASPIANTGLEYADFLLGYVQNWNAGVTPEHGGRMKSPQVFVQDDFKVSPRLTVNLGLRYQINHGWNETHGNENGFDPTVMNPATNTLGAYWYGTTHANGRGSLQANVFSTVMPRVGFSYLFDPKSTVRGGFGIYSYNWSLDTYGNGMGNAFGSSGSITDPSNGITPITKLDGTGVTFGTTTPLPYVSASTDPAAFNTQNVYFTQFHAPVPKIYQWNLSVQRSLTNNIAAQVAYVASHGFNLAFPTDLNQVPGSKLSSNDVQYRPYPQFGSITGSTNNSVSNYNSLQAEITARPSKGLSFSFNYVWSHMLDTQDSSGWGSRAGPQDYQIANDPGANYSNSNFDVRNAFKGYVVYELPVGKGKMFLNSNSLLDAVLGGWQISSTIVASSGSPFTVVSTQNTFAQAGSAYPNWTPGVSPIPHNRSISNWFNPGAFTQPANGTFGNVRRNSLYGPGLQYENLSGSKTFSLPWENVKLQIRCDAQNAFNHPSFAEGWDQYLGGSQGAGTPYTTGGNAQMSTAVNGRNLQLGARLTF